MNEKVIYVYDAFSEDKDILIGSLFVDNSKGKENYSFEYDKNWLNNNNISLDPELSLTEGRQFSAKLFGMFSDSCPDRWGRVLLAKKERLKSDEEKRKPKRLLESDYLLGVMDYARMGGLRFKTDYDGEYLSEENNMDIPPITSIRYLQEVSRNYELDESINNKWLNQLLKPGSSLGGARPKANVMDIDGSLWIAKFPSVKDEYDVCAWEKTANDLAKLCGLDVPENKLEKFFDKGSVFLVKRFDREKNKRIHYASCMTLLNKTDSMSAIDGISYLGIVSFIKAYSVEPQKDLMELYKRIVFNMLISNTDDHLRNHAFLYKKQGWKLSPLYDINPVNYGDTLSLNVDENDNSISLNLVLEVASKFNIEQNTAKTIINTMKDIIKNNWQSLATNNGITKNSQDNMKPAFSACYNNDL